VPVLILIFLLLSSFFYSLFFEREKFLEFLLIFSIIFYSQILSFSLLLGTFHFLEEKYFLLLSLLSFLFSLKLFRKPHFKNGSISPFSYFSLCVVLSFYTVIFQYTLILPPLTTDGLLYHLPFALHYIKTHSLSIPHLFFSDVAMSYYPVGGDIFYTFSLFSLPEIFVKYTQIPFVIIGSLSIFLLMKKNGFSSVSSTIAASIFALIKPVFKESSLSFVDLMMGSCFLASIYFFSSNRKEDIIPGILSSSIFLSIKTISLLFFLPVIPFLFTRKNGHLNKRLLYLSLILLIFCGFYSYIRNFILTKNPFFPVQISIGNFVIFKGIYIYSKIPFFEKLKNFLFLIKKPISMVDMSFSTSALLLFSLFGALIFSFKNKKHFYLFLIVPISTVLYLLFVPSNYHQIRHLLPLFGIMSICPVYIFKKKEKYSPFLIFLLFYLVIKNIKGIPLFLFFSLLFFLSLFIYPVSKKGIKKISLIPAFCISIYLVFWISVSYHGYKLSKFKVWKTFYKQQGSLWEFIEKNSGKGKNIAYVGEFLTYPLYGSRFQNNVFYQSINSVDTPGVYKYSGKINFPEENPSKIYRKKPSLQLWLKGLKEKKINLILIKKDKNYIERDWIKENPSLFKLIYSNKFADVYSFKEFL